MIDTIMNDKTHKRNVCAMQVHSTPGNSFQEVIYQRALAIEFYIAGLSFTRQMKMPIFYRDEKINDVHKAQSINYEEQYNIADGLLTNFTAAVGVLHQHIEEMKIQLIQKSYKS